jgi:hypothetical protein
VEQYRGTTICSVRRGGQVVMGGDGQVTLGNTVMKANARKVRRLYKDRVIAGFAGATADAFTLFERFEGKLEKHSGHLGDRGRRQLAADLRDRRRHRARARPDRHRLRRAVRAGGGPGAAEEHRSRRRGHRAPGAGHRRRYLYLHE